MRQDFYNCKNSEMKTQQNITTSWGYTHLGLWIKLYFTNKSLSSSWLNRFDQNSKHKIREDDSCNRSNFFHKFIPNKYLKTYFFSLLIYLLLILLIFFNNIPDKRLSKPGTLRLYLISPFPFYPMSVRNSVSTPSHVCTFKLPWQPPPPLHSHCLIFSLFTGYVDNQYDLAGSDLLLLQSIFYSVVMIIFSKKIFLMNFHCL